MARHHHRITASFSTRVRLRESLSVIVFKRWYSLAALVDSGQLDQYRYVLMLDAELRLASCDRLPLLSPRIEKQEALNVWYAAPIHLSPDGVAKNVACSACHGAAAPEIARQRAANAMVSATAARAAAADVGELSRLQSETRGFELFAWWTDLPWARASEIRQIIEHWRSTPGLWDPASQRGQAAGGAKGGAAPACKEL